jgi:hypothetical protein
VIGTAKDSSPLYVVGSSSDVLHYCLVVPHAIWECLGLSGPGP